MMTLSSLALALAVLFNIIYVVLALVAYGHRNSEAKASQSDGLLGLTLWWSFYEDLYDESGRNLCRYGKVLLLVTVAAYVLWAVYRA